MTVSTTEAIYRAYEERAAAEKPRPYLGASALGDPCHRRLWYGFRLAQPVFFSGRILRLFSTGHREEGRAVSDLRAIGAEVWDRDPATGGQFAIPPLCDGHLRGHADAVAKGLPEMPDVAVLIDFKTVSVKKLELLKDNGLRLQYPKYYTQAQIYMGGLDLQQAMYLFVAKDTDELHCEWMTFDETHYRQAIQKAERIIASDRPPIREYSSADYFECRWCDYKNLCWGDEVAQVNCRTCVHATPVADGKWQCELLDAERDLDEQLSGCDSHLFIPELVGGATATDAGKQWVEYRHNTSGNVFRNVPKGIDDKSLPGHYSSREIATGNALLGDAGVDLIRAQFDGEVIE